MATDNPYPAPAPLVLAKMCKRAAWRDAMDDDVRQILEWASETLPELVRKGHRLSHQVEQLEGDNALLFQLHYGPQKGGAS
jgi:hypothetical protein